MNAKYTKWALAGGIVLTGLAVLAFTGRIPLPILSPVSNENVKFTVGNEEIDAILTHPDRQAPYRPLCYCRVPRELPRKIHSTRSTPRCWPMRDCCDANRQNWLGRWRSTKRGY